MSLVYVQHWQQCIHDEHDGEEYGSWSRDNDYTVEGVVLDAKLRWGCDAIQIAPAVVEGDEVWVLYVTYCTGDSFGSDCGQGEIIWVFTNKDVADVALRKIDANQTASVFSFEDEDGEVLHLSNPANDYFSHIESVNVRSFIVGACPDPRY